MTSSKLQSTLEKLNIPTEEAVAVCEEVFSGNVDLTLVEKVKLQNRDIEVVKEDVNLIKNDVKLLKEDITDIRKSVERIEKAVDGLTTLVANTAGIVSGISDRIGYNEQ